MTDVAIIRDTPQYELIHDGRQYVVEIQGGSGAQEAAAALASAQLAQAAQSAAEDARDEATAQADIATDQAASALSSANDSEANAANSGASATASAESALLADSNADRAEAAQGAVATAIANGGADVSLRADLLAGAGSTLVGWVPSWVGGIFRHLADKLTDTASAKDFGAVGDGVALDTAALQAAVSSGRKRIRVPQGTYRVGPFTMSTPGVKLLFDKGASILPVMDPAVTQNLITITAADITLVDPAIGPYTDAITAVKRMIFINTGGDNCTIKRPVLTNLTATNGLSGDAELVVHGIYSQNASGLRVRDINLNGVSGAAVFFKLGDNIKVLGGSIHNTGWYSINGDYAATHVEIAHVRITADDPTARWGGGSVNAMSQTTGGRNAHWHVHHCEFGGYHNYAAVLRVLSIEDFHSHHNTYRDDLQAGTLAADAHLQYIVLDRRGTVEGAAENGPCKKVYMHDEYMHAGPGVHYPFYLKNALKATRDPHEDIVLERIFAYSKDATQCFANLGMVHGNKSGFVRLDILGCEATVFSQNGSPVTGGLALISTNSDGEITGGRINAKITELATGTPTQTYQVGLFLSGWARNLDVSGGTYKGFRYGARTTATGLTDIRGLYENTFIDCLEDTNYLTPPVSSTRRPTWGTSLPVKGVFSVGHVHRLTNAAASASPGWQVTTAGGAMTGLWTSGATYTAGVWMRNASGRVYELITAGGGTATVAPTGIAVGATETAADGYVWLCRATTAARWAALPALGVVAALP